MNFPGFSSRLRRGRHQNAGSSTSLVTDGRSSHEDNWNELDLSSTEYARRRKELMKLIMDLRSMGAQTLIDLPSIVVIGGQSAGKSSLVEAVSGVNVPRDSGTCTRCPMECNISTSAATWSCVVKLRFDYDSSGRPTGQSRLIPFGPTITDKSDVDVWLRRAQAAILHPNVSPDTFHKMNVQALKSFTSPNQLKFSRNVVSIFIEDPSGTDLSFVDLPGLIQNEDKEVLELVQKLTESYIERQNTIILTTIPMSDDMQNQLSVRLAREADPTGERTIGILTKPDMLGQGAVNARKQWVDVIEGREHTLKHGYYCVRLPDDAQRAQRLSRAALQRIAAEYFDNTEPWKNVSDRRRFGVPSFVQDISILLVSHINRVLPQLKKDVEMLLASCLKELGTLPKLLEADPQVEVLVRVNEFCGALKSIVIGSGSDKSLAQQNRKLYDIFAEEVRGTFPDFRPFEQPGEHSPIPPLEPEEVTTYRKGSPRSVNYGQIDSDDGTGADDNGSEASLADESEAMPIMGVYDVRKTIEDSIGWELPGNIPYEAKTRLIRQFTIIWLKPAERCLRSINDVLDEVIQELVKVHFGQFRALQNLISELISPDIEEYKRNALSAIKETLELENTPNFTENLNDYRIFREKWLAKYRNARQHPGVLCYDAKEVAEVMRYLFRAGYRGLTQDDLNRLSHPDEQFDDELTVMADVRAYFTIACKRIVDHIPLKIEHSLHHPLAERLSVSLLQRLLVDTESTGNASDRMKELVCEDPATEAKRTRLKAMQDRLQEMKRKLASFGV